MHGVEQFGTKSPTEIPTGFLVLFRASQYYSAFRSFGLIEDSSPAGFIASMAERIWHRHADMGGRTDLLTG